MLTILKSCDIIDSMLNERELNAVGTLMEAEQHLMMSKTTDYITADKCIETAASFYTPSFITAKDKLVTINLEPDYIESIELTGTIIKRHLLKPDERHENILFTHDKKTGLYVNERHGLSFKPIQLVSYINDAHKKKTHDNETVILQGLDAIMSTRLITHMIGQAKSITYAPIEHTANNNNKHYDAMDILASHH